MAGNMNNGFDGFDNSDDFNFGGDTSGGFGDDFDSGFGDGGFGDDDIFSDTSQSNSNQNNKFTDSVNNFDNQNQFQDTVAEQQGTKKQSIVLIIVGIVALVIVLIVASVISNRASKKDTTTVQNNTNTTQVVQQDNNVNVDDIVNDGNNSQSQQNQTSNQQNVITNKVDDDFTWTLITDNEQVQFNSEYSDMTFTITSIEHKARAVDTNNNLVVITTLQGSISGLSGTYELDIPYNKGVKLVVGNSFTVHVQLGTYNGKTVVGEIQY